MVPGHRSRPLFRRLGRLGMGRLGMGPQLVRREYLHRPFFLSSLRLRTFPREEDRWAAPCGRIIRNTGSACRTRIAAWQVACRYGGVGGGLGIPRRSRRRFNRGAGSTQGAAPQQHLGNPGFEQRGWTGKHSVFGGYHNGGMTRMQSDHGFSSMGAGRTFGGFHGGGGIAWWWRDGGGGSKVIARWLGIVLYDLRVGGYVCGRPAIAQERFDSPEAAAKAVIDAVRLPRLRAARRPF